MFWTRPGSTDRILSVTYEVVPAGEELVLRMSGETVYRTELAAPIYADKFQKEVQAWVAARLRAVLTDPEALPPEADIFCEMTPFGNLDAALAEANRRNCSILGFVYDPTQPERGELRYALSAFLRNRRARDLMTRTFVVALLPLAAIAAVSGVLDEQSMETARWVILDRQLRPLEQQTIYANSNEGERIIGGLAARYALESGKSA